MSKVDGNLVSPLRRLASFSIDLALIVGALYVGAEVVATPLDLPPLEALVGLVVAIGSYYAGLTWAMGATPGKLAVGAEVVRPDGSWPGLGRAIARLAVWLLLPVIAWAFVLGREHRGLHDLIADTYVVRSARS